VKRAFVLGAVLPAVAWACSNGDSSTDAGSDGAADVNNQPDVAADVASDSPVVDSSPDVASDAGDASDGGGPVHAYVTNFQSSPGLLVYNLPLTPSSTPAVTLTSGLSGPTDVEIIGNQLMVLDRGGAKVVLFNLPITSQSAPAISFSMDANADDAAFDAQGNLWIGGLGGVIEEFTAPLSNASTKALTLSIPTGNAFALAFDTNGNLYAGGYSNGGIYVYAPPITAQSTPVITNLVASGPTGFAIHNAKLYASVYFSSQILAFDLPLTNDAGATSVGTNISSPERLAFAGNNLGLADHTTGVHVFAAPAFTSEVVAIAKGGDSGLADPRGIAFGP
jgi:hypothetical protein